MGSDNEYEHQRNWSRGYDRLMNDLRKDFGSARVDMLLRGLRVEDEDLRVIMGNLKPINKNKNENNGENKKSNEEGPEQEG